MVFRRICSKKKEMPCGNMMTSSNGNIFRVTGHSCEEFNGDRWIPRTKASDAELSCFPWSAPKKNGSVNNGEAGDLRSHRSHYDVIVMNFPRYMTRAVCPYWYHLQIESLVTTLSIISNKHIIQPKQVFDTKVCICSMVFRSSCRDNNICTFVKYTYHDKSRKYKKRYRACLCWMT